MWTAVFIVETAVFNIFFSLGIHAQIFEDRPTVNRRASKMRPINGAKCLRGLCRVPYCQLYYHFVWTTKYRQPLLTPSVEPIIHNFLRSKAVGLGGIVFALNGVEDHVHLVTTVPAKLAVATFVGQVKGVASTKFNKEYPNAEPFFWQREYGVFSFDKKRLPYVVRYVRNQKEHHRAQTIIPVLERSDDGKEPTIVKEDAVEYLADEALWWQEMQTL